MNPTNFRERGYAKMMATLFFLYIQIKARIGQWVNFKKHKLPI